MAAALLGLAILTAAPGARAGPSAPPAERAPWVHAKHRALLSVAPEIDPDVLRRALVAALTAKRAGFARRRPFLTVIDYGRPAHERRLWVFDLRAERLAFREHVAHGRGSGGDRASRWSNQPGSDASSPGLYVTREIYRGRRGRSLRLIGLEPGFNDLAYRRSIVMHGAPYMSAEHFATHGRFGQSHGCPALSHAVARPIIELIAGGSLVFVDAPDPAWRARSAWFRGQIPRNLRARPRVRGSSARAAARKGC